MCGSRYWVASMRRHPPQPLLRPSLLMLLESCLAANSVQDVTSDVAEFGDPSTRGNDWEGEG